MQYVLQGLVDSQRLQKIVSSLKNVFGFGQKERKQKFLESKELTYNREFYRSLIDNTTDIILIITADATIQYVSPSCQRSLGYLPEEIIAIGAFGIVHPDDQRLVTDTIAQTILNPGLAGPTIELRVRHKDSSWHYLEATEKGIIGTAGEIVAVANLHDITDHKRSEEEIRKLNAELEKRVLERTAELTEVNEALFESRQMLQLVLNTIPQHVFWKGPHLQYLGCNQPFLEDTGLNGLEELIGKTDFDMFWKADAITYRTDDSRALKNSKSKLNYDETYARPGGSQAWRRTSKVPLHDREGKVISILGTYQDITEQKKIEETLRKSEATLKSVFAASPEGIVFDRSRVHPSSIAKKPGGQPVITGGIT